MKQKTIKGKKVYQLTLSDTDMFADELKHINRKLLLRFFAWTNKYARVKEGFDVMQSVKHLKQFLQSGYKKKMN